MRFAIIIVALVAALAAGCGAEPGADAPDDALEQRASAVRMIVPVDGQLGASYQCGGEWWHVEQWVRQTVSGGVKDALPAFASPTDDSSTKAVTIKCFDAPTSMTDTGWYLYSATALSSCIMYTHLPGKAFAGSATISVPVGSLQYYPSNGAPGDRGSWLLQAVATGYVGANAGDGIWACGGRFTVVLQ